MYFNDLAIPNTSSFMFVSFVLMIRIMLKMISLVN